MAVWDFVESDGKCHILVIDGGGSMNSALVGGILSRMAQDNGWAGIVVNGCIRDVDDVNDSDIGVRAIASHPKKPAKKGINKMHVTVNVDGALIRDGEWLYGESDGIIVSKAEVLNCVVYLTWLKRRQCPISYKHWNLPTYFDVFAKKSGNDAKVVDRKVFGTSGKYKSNPAECSTVSIPLHDENHWFLCRVDFDKGNIEIFDTFRSATRDTYRRSLARKAVVLLEEVSNIWEGGPFKAEKGWSRKFVCRHRDNLSPQPNTYDCGLYVCLLMMFTNVFNRQLSELESISTRRRLAYMLYTCKENLCAMKSYLEAQQKGINDGMGFSGMPDSKPEGSMFALLKAVDPTVNEDHVFVYDQLHN